MSGPDGPEAESDFRIEELFFSRTDGRGIIQAGNAVFQRVARYDWEELLGAPHKIIRHPDMPKAVFWLLWDTIQRGEPIGAYVKNRARDGAHYWVYAIVTPVDGGYLSIRLKPTSELFDVIRQEYAALRAREDAEGLSPEQGARELLARLRELKYRDYTSLMTRALVDETTARDAAIGARSDIDIGGAHEIQRLARGSLSIALAIIADLARIGGFPINLQIQASKLGAAAAMFRCIADSYSRLSGMITRDLRQFSDAAERAAGSVDRGLFRLLTARYQDEMAHLFENDKDEAGEGAEFDRPAEARMLTSQRDAYVGDLAECLEGVAAECTRFNSQARQMYGTINGLNVTQLLGLIETARLGTAGRTLDSMLKDVSGVQAATSKSIRDLAALNADISRMSSSMAARF